MTRAIYFPMADTIQRICLAMNVDADRVVRRAGLPRDFLQNEGKGATPQQALAGWSALEAEYTEPDFARRLAKALAHAPLNSAMFAFSCSPDVETGLRRLAVFKPLVGPIRLNFEQDAFGLKVAFHCVGVELDIPPFLPLFETMFILEATRTYTATHVVPQGVGLPSIDVVTQQDRDHLGVDPVVSEVPYLLLSQEDATRILITENSEMWPEFEKRMRAKLAEQDDATRMTTRVRTALLDMLPSGDTTIEALCTRLNMSKRSVQRYLKDEGQSYKAVLASTRAELAQNYLKDGSFRVEEISFLLGYKEPNSFYRAFQDWTGMTPSQARSQSK